MSVGVISLLESHCLLNCDWEENVFTMYVCLFATGSKKAKADGKKCHAVLRNSGNLSFFFPPEASHSSAHFIKRLHTTWEAMLKTCQTLLGTSRVLSWRTPSSGMSSGNLNVMIDCNFLECFLHQSISPSLCSFEQESREWHRRTWYCVCCVLPSIMAACRQKLQTAPWRGSILLYQPRVFLEGQCRIGVQACPRQMKQRHGQQQQHQRTI